MIINTGQRTDIPAFYSKWFINRIKEGYVLVRNPYYPNLVTKFILNPSVVDVIGFCSKNPHPMLKYLDDLKEYNLFWHITINAYDSDIEPNVPKIDEVINDFIYLSNKLGKNSVVWRYTPIIIDDKETILLIDSWESQEALDIHHKLPLMKRIMNLRDKYNLHMKVEKYEEISDDKDKAFIRK